MPTYRIYKLNRAGGIAAGEWLEAPDESAAKAAAHALCDRATPSVEIWLKDRRIAILPCDDEQTVSHA